MAKRLSYKDLQAQYDDNVKALRAAEAIADTLVRTQLGVKAQRPDHQDAIRYSADDGVTWVEVLACKLASASGGFVAVQSAECGYPAFVALDDWADFIKTLHFHGKAEYAREDSLLTHYDALLTRIRIDQRRALDALYNKA